MLGDRVNARSLERELVEHDTSLVLSLADRIQREGRAGEEERRARHEVALRERFFQMKTARLGKQEEIVLAARGPEESLDQRLARASKVRGFRGG